MDQLSIDLMDMVASGKKVPIEIGIDGFNHIGRSLSISNLIFQANKRFDSDAEFVEAVRSIIRLQTRKQPIWTGTLPFEQYFPHYKLDADDLKKKLVPRLQEIVNNYNDKKAEYDLWQKKLNDILLTTHRDKDGNIIKDAKVDENIDFGYLDDDLKTLYDEYKLEAIGVKSKLDEYSHQYINLNKKIKGYGFGLDDIDEIRNEDSIHELAMQKLSEKETRESENIDDALRYEMAGRRVKSQNRREAGVIKYDYSKDSLEEYFRSIINALHKNAAWVISKNRVMTAERNSEYGDNTSAWVKFMKLYISDSLGNPTIITADMLNDPSLKLKGNPYYYLTDSYVSKWLYSIGEKIGLIKGQDKLPDEMKHLDYSLLNKISQLEAKYEMVSLLAHTKSMIANLFGGTQMTAISVGFENLRKARDLNYLRENINSKWNTKEDMAKDVISAGVVEEYLINEAGLASKSFGANVQMFIKEAISLINKHPDTEDATLLSLARKYNVSDSVFDKAAWFMRRAERTLRRDAYLAHYVHWYNLFGGTLQGYYDKEGIWRFNPILDKLAKDGVKTTQFLYTAPYRPAIARTAFGKILTRFQLWTYNSVATRSMILDQAKIYGFAEGEATSRFERMMAMDLVTLGLAQAFMFSLFDSALPAPWSWLTDFANWIFGNDKERDSAFFGAYPTAIAPLQMITPPVMRMFPSMISSMISGDWKRFTDYTIPTMFPFGRLARDIQKSYLNPKSTIDRLTGIPFSRMEGFGKETLEEEGNNETTNRSSR